MRSASGAGLTLGGVTGADILSTSHCIGGGGVIDENQIIRTMDRKQSLKAASTTELLRATCCTLYSTDVET